MTGVFRVFVPYLSYQLNYEYISTVLCENKNKPDMHCEGKCQLNKDLKKTAQEESKKQTVVQNIQSEEIPFAQCYYSTPCFYLLNEVSYIHYSEHSLSHSLKNTTPPPRA